MQLAGIVTGPITGDSHAGGMRFKLKDFDGPETVDVVYTGSCPSSSRSGGTSSCAATLTGGTFVGVEDSLVMKCPSKYAPRRTARQS